MFTRLDVAEDGHGRVPLQDGHGRDPPRDALGSAPRKRVFLVPAAVAQRCQHGQAAASRNIETGSRAVAHLQAVALTLRCRCERSFHALALADVLLQLCRRAGRMVAQAAPHTRCVRCQMMRYVAASRERATASPAAEAGPDLERHRFHAASPCVKRPQESVATPICGAS